MQQRVTKEAMDREPLSWVFQLGAIIQTLDGDLRQHCNVSLEDYRILVILAQGPCVQGLLADRLQRADGVVSRWLTRLGYERCLKRQPSETDRREIVLMITRRGRNHMKKAHEHLMDRLSILAVDLSNAEKAVLYRVEKSASRVMT